MPIAVSAQDKSRTSATIQIYLQKTLKLGDQIVDLRGLKDRKPHIRNLPNQSNNLYQVQVILGQDSYNMHCPLEFKQSDDKTAQWAVTSKIGWALTGPLPAKQAATFVTTATSVKEYMLASQLNKGGIRLQLCYNVSFERRTESNQNIGANNLLHRWKIRSWTSVARRWSEVCK